MTIRFAMVGSGKMASTMIAQFAACPGVELTTLVASSMHKGRHFAEKFGIDRVVELHQLDRTDVDVVYIATPHHNHVEVASAVILAGIPVLVEKAFATNAIEAEQLVALARSSEVFLMEAMWMGFNRAVRAAHDVIRSGGIGEPRQLAASFGRPVPFDRTNRLWDPSRGGGSLLDQGVYPLALSDLFFGHPTEIHAVGSQLGYDFEDVGVNTEASMLLGFAGGSQAIMSTSIRTQLPSHATIGGSEGMIRLEAPFWATSRSISSARAEPPSPATSHLTASVMCPCSKRFGTPSTSDGPSIRSAPSTQASQSCPFWTRSRDKLVRPN